MLVVVILKAATNGGVTILGRLPELRGDVSTFTRTPLRIESGLSSGLTSPMDFRTEG